MPSRTGRAIRHLITAIALIGTPVAAAAMQSVQVIDLVPGEPRAIRFPKGASIYSVSAKIVDAKGDPIEGLRSWTVKVGSGRFSAIVNLTSDQAQLTIPRPLGLPLELGDSLVVIAETVGAADAHIRISVGYELGETAGRRLAVRAVSTEAEPAEVDEVSHAATEETYSWTVDADARLVAINARQFVGAASVTLEDALTGEVIWRQDGPSRFASAVAQLGETLRLGKSVEGGRTYRLRIRRAAGEQARLGTPVVMLVPRTAQRVIAGER